MRLLTRIKHLYLNEFQIIRIKTGSFKQTAPHKCTTMSDSDYVHLQIPMTSSTSVTYMLSTRTGLQTASVFTSNTHFTLRHEVSKHQTFTEEERLIGN